MISCFIQLRLKVPVKLRSYSCIYTRHEVKYICKDLSKIQELQKQTQQTQLQVPLKYKYKYMHKYYDVGSLYD